MDKAFFIYVLIGIGFFYVVTHFVNDIQEEEDSYKSPTYLNEHRYDKYMSRDTVDRPILNLRGADSATQVAAWNNSHLKNELIELLPNFDQMKMFIEERIHGGDALQQKLEKLLKSIDDRYISGIMTIEEAKYELGTLK